MMARDEADEYVGVGIRRGVLWWKRRLGKGGGRNEYF